MDLYIKSFSDLTGDDVYDILKARHDVFIVEQNCPCEEIDGRDRGAYHVFYRDNGVLIAYLRVLDRGVIFDDVAIGRVLCLDRRKGIGSSLMREGIKVAREKFGADKIVIEAQTYVRSMYDKLGFVQTSDEFLDHGIPHIKMELEIN